MVSVPQPSPSCSPQFSSVGQVVPQEAASSMGWSMQSVSGDVQGPRTLRKGQPASVLRT